LHRAIFLDRDGTINEDVGDLYSAERLIFIPRAIEALDILQQHFILFIITNQSGIGKQVFSEETFLKFNEYFIQLLNSYGITIQHVFYCPHTKEDNCVCRKPKQYFIREAETRYDIDVRSSIAVQDSGLSKKFPL